MYVYVPPGGVFHGDAVREHHPYFVAALEQYQTDPFQGEQESSVVCGCG